MKQIANKLWKFTVDHSYQLFLLLLIAYVIVKFNIKKLMVVDVYHHKHGE